MDTAVALAQAYLHVNGYFTVTEYAVLEATGRTGYRMATDLDILALRFAGAGRLVPGGRPEAAQLRFEPDPELECPADSADMLIAEVKEGRPALNPAVRTPRVLQVALVRFGCSPATDSRSVVETLLRKGEATTSHGHRVRIVAFGSGGTASGGPVSATIDLGHVAHFLRDHLRAHWDVLHHAQFKDPVLAFLAVLEKAGASELRTAGAAPAIKTGRS